MLTNFIPGGYQAIQAYINHPNHHITNYSRSIVRIVDAAFEPIKGFNGYPIINLNSNTITVIIPYYILNNINLTTDMINSIKLAINIISDRPVELYIIKLTKPYHDAQVLAAYISLAITQTKFNHVTKRLFKVVSPIINNYNMPALYGIIVGIKVELNGRLQNENAQPRITKQVKIIGNLTATSNTILNTASFTTINDKNTYTIKVQLAQRIVV